MPERDFLSGIVDGLSRVAGVEAVVLGGSRSQGTHTADSDFDIGIYYASADALDIPALDRLAARLDDRRQSGLVTAIGGWGPWINGGGWLTVDGQHVDFLYRDLGRVAQAVEDGRAGRFEFVYQPGHPHGFASTTYMSEVAVCGPLWDPCGRVAALKALTQPYPVALRRAIIERFFWEADFSLGVGGKGIARGDLAHVAGCAFRAVMCLTQCLFALNGRYWLNEKGAVARIATFPTAPVDYADRVRAAFADLDSPESLQSLHALAAETADLIAAAGQ